MSFILVMVVLFLLILLLSAVRKETLEEQYPELRIYRSEDMDWNMLLQREGKLVIVVAESMIAGTCVRTYYLYGPEGEGTEETARFDFVVNDKEADKRG